MEIGVAVLMLAFLSHIPWMVAIYIRAEAVVIAECRVWAAIASTAAYVIWVLITIGKLITHA